MGPRIRVRSSARPNTRWTTAKPLGAAGTPLRSMSAQSPARSRRGCRRLRLHRSVTRAGSVLFSPGPPYTLGSPIVSPRDSPGGRQDEAKGAIEHSTDHKVGGGVLGVCWEEALVGVARARAHRAGAPPPAGAACCPRGSWLPWGGEAEHLLGQEEAVLRVSYPVLHAPAAAHGERDVAGHS